MSTYIPTRTALTCLWRTAAINSAMTARGMQQLGLIYVLAPALRHLYPEPQARRDAFKRYAEHSNTHVFMFPSYAGILINLESQAARGAIPVEALGAVRQTIATTLSALGDSFFSGALRTTWALVCISLCVEEMYLAAALVTGLLILFLQIFRVVGFFTCLQHGISALGWIRRMDVTGWTQRFKRCNAVLVGLTLWLMIALDLPDAPLPVQVGLFLFIPAASWCVGRLNIPRTLLWTLALCFFIAVESKYIRF